MLFTKMNQIIDEISAEVAEREDLIECIAIALLSCKNLFILGETGQAKSHAINLFRRRITGAKQFERLMSKQTDEERLDLSSLIPGNLPQDELMQDETYVAGNAAITADCAVRLAGEKLKAIFRDSPALILGWGRIGKCLAQLLAGLGCPVTVAARKESDRAILSALGIRALDYRELPATLDRYSLIFNTVPEMVLKAEPPETCVCIDLASRRGIPGDSVIWARGLPGVHAPRSSGKLIAERILYYLKEEQQ